MPLQRRTQIVALIGIAILIVIAAVLGFWMINSHNFSKPASYTSQSTDPLELTDQSISSAINGSQFLVLDFYYPGCGSCNFMNKTTLELSNDLHGQIKFGRINGRANRNTVKRYKISSYPTLLFFDEGILMNRIRDNTSKSDLLAEIMEFRPELNTSKVQPKPGGAAAAAASGAIPLAVFGENKPSMPMLLNDDNLNSAIRKYPYLVVAAYVHWCGACQGLNVTLSELSSELQGQVAFGLIDAGKNNATKARYNITSYPTLLIYKDGKLAERLIGNRAKSVFVSELKRYYPQLDVSKVKMRQSASQAPAISPAQKETAAAAARQATGQDIPLARPGLKNPKQAMLITDDTLNSAVSQYPLLVVEGYADWCSSCKSMNVTISSLASELQGQAAFGLMDIKGNKQTKIKYNITSYPTLLIFKNGKLAGKVIGNQQKSSFVAKLRQIEPKLNTSRVKIAPATPKAPAKPKLTPEQVCTNMTKYDKSLLEVFVVSRCPFGLQMQRIMANLISQTQEAERYLKVRYLGSVANGTIASMHGPKEAQENQRQICIREEQSSKYWDYVRCYMKEGKSRECLKASYIDADKLDSCTNDSSRGLAYAQKDFDLAGKLGITGSPTLVMGDKRVSDADFATNTTSRRSPETLKELLCCGFKSEPSFCSQEFNKSRMATMFSPG